MSHEINRIVVELRKAATDTQRQAILANIERECGAGFAAHVRAAFDGSKFDGERVRPKPHHAAPPGSGPTGETCGGCAHYAPVERARKPAGSCTLTRHLWHEGPLGMIGPADLSCRHWERKADVCDTAHGN